MARLSPARRAALALVSERRRRDGRIRDIARTDEGMARLDPLDRALAFRLAVGATAAQAVVDGLVGERLKRPSSLEPRVRDAFELAAYEVCYLDTPAQAAVSQGVELVRSVVPRAAGMANAVLRRLAREVRPAVEAARAAMAAGEATAQELSLAAALPLWLVERVCEERGSDFAHGLCAAQAAPAPVYIATNGLRRGADEMHELLQKEGLAPEAVEGLSGSFALGEPAGLARTGLVERVDLVVADLSAQLVCRLVEGAQGCRVLELGQGRGTKSVLMATALGACHPGRIVGVDAVGSKVRLSRKRMEAAGLAECVSCVELDGCRLAEEDLPKELDGLFDVVLVDAPCSGTGTMRRHPELPASLDAVQVKEISQLQSRLLAAASARVAPGGTLLYSTCSVMRDEDERVVEAFLAGEEGRGFACQPVMEAPAVARDEALARLVSAATTADGHLLTTPSPTGGDGHFCARLVKSE